MTNTLHRFGAPESFCDDYIVFAMAARGINEGGAAEKQKAFLRLAASQGPVNLGHGATGSVYRPDAHLTPLAHWRRSDGRLDPEAIGKEIDGGSVVAAVFDDPAKV